SNFWSYYTPPVVVATSSGDNVLSIADAANPDRWVVLDDNFDNDPFLQFSPPAVADVFDGPGAVGRVSAASLTTLNSSARQLAYRWSNVIVPPGGSVAYLHFGVQQTSRAAAQAAAGRLVQLPPEALAGLTPDELSAVRNFAAPIDGVSALEPLP